MPGFAESLSDTAQRLRGEWCRLLQPWGVDDGPAERAFTELASAYAGAGRHYHTLAHVADVQAAVEALRSFTEHLPAVQLAAWFHDVVYDPRAGDNEERSAAHAATALRELGVPPEVSAAAQRLILLTKRHVAAEGDRDGRVLLDADLAILGAPGPAYRAYADAIRREYAWVLEEAYRAGRRQVLQTFLRRDRIYHTPPMVETRERQARINLEQEIAALQEGGTP